MNPGTTDPTRLQQEWLENLERQFQLVNQNVQAFFAASPLHSSSELSPWISYMAAVESFFAQFRSMALYLKGMGYDQLFERLEQVIRDVHQAGATYAEMYKNALDAEGQRRTTAQASSQQWFDTMQNIMKTQQAAFDAANARWEANFRGEK
jgi:hypothetical protein